METNFPKVALDIIILRDNKILLGLLSKDWLYEGKQVYGLPGRDLHFRETMGDGVKRNIEDELGCTVNSYKIIAVNANYAFDNHYIGIGVLAEIEGEVQNKHLKDWEKWEWFEKDKLPTNLFPSAKNLLESYVQNKICISE